MADQHSEKWNSSKNMKKSKDAHKIQLTNDSSIGSKKSAHVLGYFEDDLLAYKTCNKLRILELCHNKKIWMYKFVMSGLKKYSPSLIYEKKTVM